MDAKRNQGSSSVATLDDLAHGQVVIVTARWIMVLAGLLFALWNPSPIGQLRIQLIVILLIAVGNFYLHAQLLMRKPTLGIVAYGASAADIAAITFLIVLSDGFASNAFTFYFPAVLAFSVAFSTWRTFTFTGTVLLLYTLGGLVKLFWTIRLSIALSAIEADLQVVIVRLLMLAAVATCGNLYWRIERERRRAARHNRDVVITQIQNELTPTGDTL
jgi:hypothetical protein